MSMSAGQQEGKEGEAGSSNDCWPLWWRSGASSDLPRQNQCFDDRTSEPLLHFGDKICTAFEPQSFLDEHCVAYTMQSEFAGVT